jgi:hypothetical protein
MIDNIPRKALMRDISFSGAKLIIAGLAKFLVNKSIITRLDIEETNTSLNILGKILRFEPIANRKDIASIAIQFEETQLPIEYKLLINDYITTQKRPEISVKDKKES